MTKRSWKESMKAFGSHIDPEKEEQLKWIKIEIENKLKRIAKLIKKINQGSREGNLRGRSELLQLLDDFHKQYQSIYSMYDNLKGEVRKKLHEEHEGNSSSQSSSLCSNSESYFSVEVKETVEKFETSTSEAGEFSLIEKAKEKEDEILYLTDDFELWEKERLSHIKGLEDQVASMKFELDNLCVEKRELEEQLVWELNEVEKIEESNSWLQYSVLALEATIIEKDDQFFHLLKESDENQLNSSSRMDDLMVKSHILQQEVDRLNVERHELEQKLLNEIKKGSEQAEKTHFSEQEVDRLRVERSELEKKLLRETNKGSEKFKDLELSHEKKSYVASDRVKDITERTKELSECHRRIENLKEELTSTTLSVEGLKSDVKSLEKEKRDMEEKIFDMNQESYHSELRKEKLNDKIMELETKLLGKEAEVGILQKKHEAYLNDMSTQGSTLTSQISNIQNQLQIAETEKHEFSQSLLQMEKKNTELTVKIAEQDKNLRGMEDVVNKLKEEHKQMEIKLEDSKSNFHSAERKLGQMTEELRKMFEDSLRILSRRIRVAEQLQIENKEWYQKTRNSDEKENKDLNEKNARNEMGIKDISLTASDILGSLDSMALKFEECTAHLLNRISKNSCELQYVKDGVMRKNKALAHIINP